MTTKLVLCQTAWNTGASYSAAGQRIAARWIKLEDSSSAIVFNDIDRGIWGQIPLAAGLFIGDRFKLRELTMANYNHGNYDHPSDLDAQVVLGELSKLASGVSA